MFGAWPSRPLATISSVDGVRVEYALDQFNGPDGASKPQGQGNAVVADFIALCRRICHGRDWIVAARGKNGGRKRGERRLPQPLCWAKCQAARRVHWDTEN